MVAPQCSEAWALSPQVFTDKASSLKVQDAAVAAAILVTCQAA